MKGWSGVLWFFERGNGLVMDSFQRGGAVLIGLDRDAGGEEG